MDKDDFYFIRWIIKQDGTEWQQLYGEEPVPFVPTPLPQQEPSAEHPLYDYDKLIQESGLPYSLWWQHWKRIHPEWALHPEPPKEPIKTAPTLKPKPTFKPLSCKRCNHTWTPRSKEPPVQCPKCHSPYWNRERKKI